LGELTPTLTTPTHPCTARWFAPLSCLRQSYRLCTLNQLTRVHSSSFSVLSRLLRPKKSVKDTYDLVLPLRSGLPKTSLESKLPLTPPDAPFVRSRAQSGPSPQCTSVTAANAAPRSSTNLSSLSSPSTYSPRFAFRPGPSPGIGRPPVFQRPAALGTATSGIILPRRKDGHDLWGAEDNVLDEAPDAQERLKSQILVTSWLDAGEPSRKLEGQDQEQEQEVNATPALSPTPEPVLHIGSDAHESSLEPAFVVDLVESDDEKEDKLPELDLPASSTVDSRSVITHHTGETLVSPVIRSPSEKDTSPPRIGMLLPIIEEPDTTTAEQGRDQFSGGPLSLGLPPQKRRWFGSRRCSVQQANTASQPNALPSTTAPTKPTTLKAGRRQSVLAALTRRQSVLPPLSEAELARAEEKMVQPTIHTMGTLNVHVMNLENEEDRRLAELAYFG
jgi:hypothetical protein